MVARRKRASSAIPSTNHDNGHDKPKRSRKPKQSAADPVAGTSPVHVNGQDDDLTAGVLCYTANDVLPAEWFFEPYVPRHTYTLLVGDPGTGKSTFGSFLAARAGASIVFPGEEDIRRTVLARLLKAGVNLDKVTFIPAGERWKFPRARDRLIKLIRKTGARLVFIDPLDPYLEEGYDENLNLPMREVLQSITEASEATGIATIIIRHPGRAVGNILAGSRAFGTHPRAVLRFDKVPDMRDRGIIQPHKPPLGYWSPPRYYDLVGREGEARVFTLGDQVEPGRATEALEVPDRMERSKIDQAVELLRRLLADGVEMDSKDVYKHGEALRLKERTIRYAADRLGVRKRWEGSRGETRCYWSLEASE